MSTFRRVPLSSVSAPEAPLRHAMERGSLEELARSIATVGLLQPLTVKIVAEGYEVIAGHRRLTACRMLGLAEVEVIVREDDAKTEAAVMLVENIQRNDLTPIEEARALRRGVDELGLSIEELARQASRSEAWVRGRLDLLTWPLRAVEAISTGAATVAALRPLMEIENVTERDRLLECAIDGGATAAVTKQWALAAQGFAQAPTEGLSAKGQALVGLVDVTVQMPCFSCREPRDALSLQILRICKPCLTDLSEAAANAAAANAVAG